MIISWIVALSILGGQLVKIPVGTHGGLTLLDITVIGLILVGFYQTRLHLIKPPKFIIAAIIFITIALLSLILTSLHLTTAQYLTSFFYTLRFSLYILLGWLILSGAFSSLKKNIDQVLLVSGISLAILGLLQFVFLPDLSFTTSAGWDPHYFRTVSTFLDPNFAGAYFALTLLLLMSSPRSNNLIFVVAGMTLIYLALLTTFSRSSYLMFLISGLVLSFLKKSKVMVVVVIILFLGLLLGFHIYTQLVAKPRNIEREKSASFRLDTWQQGLVMFQKSPILGVGFNSYRYALGEFSLADDQFILRHGASSNDSSLLYVVATTGIIGLISYLFFLATLLIGRRGSIVTVGLLGLVIHSLFANSLFYPPILIWIILNKVSDIAT